MLLQLYFQMFQPWMRSSGAAKKWLSQLAQRKLKLIDQRKYYSFFLDYQLVKKVSVSIIDIDNKTLDIV